MTSGCRLTIVVKNTVCVCVCARARVRVRVRACVRAWVYVCACILVFHLRMFATHAACLDTSKPDCQVNFGMYSSLHSVNDPFWPFFS